MKAEETIEPPPHLSPERVVDFDIYAPPGARSDFHRAWASLQEPGVPDVVWTPRNGGHWIPTRNDVIAEVFSDHKRFSARTNIIPKAPGDEHKLLPTTLDPPEHAPFRMLLNSTLAPQTVRGLESKIRDIAAGLIETFQHRGSCNFTMEYAELFPIQIFLGMIDLPLEDAAMMKGWSDAMNRPDATKDWGADHTGFAYGIRKFFEYLEPHIEARSGGSGTDVLSRLINGRVEGGRMMTKREALQISAQTLIAGLDTVVNFLGFVMQFLARNAAHRRELAADPSRIPAAIEEFFRRFPIVTIAREVVDDLDFHGAPLKRGVMIAAPTTLGGIDARRNERPLDVDFDRADGDHVTFGGGQHRCPGAHLARTEIRITLEEWLKRIPEFEVAPGQDVQFTGGIVAVVDPLPLVWNVAERAS